MDVCLCWAGARLRGSGAFLLPVCRPVRPSIAQGGARHPKKGRSLLREGSDMRFAFIARHRSIWPVAWLCDALDVSRSGFHAWLNPLAEPALLGRRDGWRQGLCELQGQRRNLWRSPRLARCPG